MSSGERALVEWLRQRFGGDSPRVPISIGDDMAAVHAGAGAVLVTADMLMDGVDFRSAEHDAALVGRKALAAGLSDCAAMAVRPLAAIVSLALPEAWTLVQVQRLYEGMAPLAEAFACPIAGGDTNSWAHPLVVDVTVLAMPYAGLAPVRRSGALVGDGLYVSGPLGGSLLGRHFTFEPRVVAARRLLEQLRGGLHALMDISDGLSIDASRLAAASGVGIELDAGRLAQHAIHADARNAAAQSGRTPLDHALHDGEDFELLAACASNAETIETPAATFVRIGRVVEQGLTLLQPDGERVALEPRGYEHWRGAAGKP